MPNLMYAVREDERVRVCTVLPAPGQERRDACRRAALPAALTLLTLAAATALVADRYLTMSGQVTAAHIVGLVGLAIGPLVMLFATLLAFADPHAVPAPEFDEAAVQDQLSSRFLGESKIVRRLPEDMARAFRPHLRMQELRDNELADAS